jgi:hypothetical protein
MNFWKIGKAARPLGCFPCATGPVMGTVQGCWAGACMLGLSDSGPRPCGVARDEGAASHTASAAIKRKNRAARSPFPTSGSARRDVCEEIATPAGS